MSSSQAMGYFAPPAPMGPPPPMAPPPPAPPVPVMPASAYGAAGPITYTPTPTVPGQQPVATWDTWVPTSQADPYVAGMRTSGSALAALIGAPKAAINAKWNGMLNARRAAGLTKMNKTLSAASKSQSAKETFMAGKTFGAAKASVKGPGLLGAFRGTFLSLGNIARAVGSAALFAVPIAVVTNFLDFQAGKINEQQRNALIVADVGGYTATGATSSLIGGFVGTLAGPMVGTIVGVAAGFGLGWVYEKYIRPRWGDMVRNAMYATQPVVTPPIVTPPYNPYPPPK